MKVIIFEDNKFKNLFPLNMLRASFDIKCGAVSIKERIINILCGRYDVSLICRNSIAAMMSEINELRINEISKDDILFLNGRVIFSQESLEKIISEKKKNTANYFKEEVVSAYLTKDKIKEFKSCFERSFSEGINFEEFFKRAEVSKIDFGKNEDIFILKYPWDAVKYLLQGGLTTDLEIYLNSKKKLKPTKRQDNFVNHKGIYVSSKTLLNPGSILDASEGKIVIEENCVIEPFCFIKGPVFIGKNTLVKSGTKIYGPCSIGKNSKVAGEIAESIFHSYVNKQHDGFIGHSYICPFVNLGADTVTSDLKNNYSKIRINIGDQETETGMQFLGSIIGDHTKTSINTMLNTGTIAGIFANIFGGGFPSKSIDSFTWNDGSSKPVPYILEKAVKTAVTVMSRRGIKLSKNYEELMMLYSK